MLKYYNFLLLVLCILSIRAVNASWYGWHDLNWKLETLDAQLRQHDSRMTEQEQRLPLNQLRTLLVTEIMYRAAENPRDQGSQSKAEMSCIYTKGFTAEELYNAQELLLEEMRHSFQTLSREERQDIYDCYLDNRTCPCLYCCLKIRLARAPIRRR